MNVRNPDASCLLNGRSSQRWSRSPIVYTSGKKDVWSDIIGHGDLVGGKNWQVRCTSLKTGVFAKCSMVLSMGAVLVKPIASAAHRTIRPMEL